MNRQWQQDVFAHVLRFCGPEDDEDDELIEVHVTKVCLCVWQRNFTL